MGDAPSAGRDRRRQSLTLHAFRGALALIMLRGGTDIFTLAKRMGHSTFIVLQGYLMQTTEDEQTAQRENGPVDKLLKDRDRAEPGKRRLDRGSIPFIL